MDLGRGLQARYFLLAHMLFSCGYGFLLVILRSWFPYNFYDELLIILIIPVFYASFHYPRIIYLLSIPITFGVATVSVFYLVGNVQGSLYSVAAILVMTLTSAEMIYHSMQKYKQSWRMQKAYEFIANTASEFMTLINRNYVYEAANQSYCQAHNLEQKDIIGKSAAEIWGEERFKTFIKDKLDRCLAGEIVRDQSYFDFPGLGNRYFRVTYYPYPNGGEEISHVVVVSHDYTESKQAEDLLQQAHDSLEQEVEKQTAELRIANEQLQNEIIERKHIEETLKWTADNLAIRNQITEIFLTKPDIEMFGEVLRVVLKILDSKHGLFGYIDENGDIVYPSLSDEVWSQCRIPGKSLVFPRSTWGGMWGKSLMEKKSLYSNMPYHVPAGHLPIRRSLSVPVIHQGELIGHIHVGNKATDYNEIDKSLLETIAGNIAPVLNARLQRDRQERERRRAEEELKQAHNDLELRVLERTETLTRLNEQLTAEIAERNRIEQKIQESLKEKEILLREIHHRVKNNMQVISSLLDLQRRYAKDPETLKILDESKNRIRSMSLVHEKLYQSKNFANINFKEYLQDLIATLYRSYVVNTQKIGLKTAIEDISIGIDTAIPLGLILNELISNSLKHAFPGERKGELVISLHALDQKEYELEVKDDGVGISEEISMTQFTSIGLKLVHGLVKHQLGGDLEFIRNNGTECRIRFKDNPG